MKAGDTSPVGTFKTSTIEALHKAIDEKKEGLFPSLKAVTTMKQLLDEEAKRLVGYEYKGMKYGEVWFLNFDNSLRLLLKACGLNELATTQSVSIALVIDGADLTRDRIYASEGVKITDPRGIHPISKQPLLLKEDDGSERFVKVQSFELCSLMMIADARDSKPLYEDVFKVFYDWVGKQISIHGRLSTTLSMITSIKILSMV